MPCGSDFSVNFLKLLSGISAVFFVEARPPITDLFRSRVLLPATIPPAPVALRWMLAASCSGGPFCPERPFSLPSALLLRAARLPRPPRRPETPAADLAPEASGSRLPLPLPAPAPLVRSPVVPLGTPGRSLPAPAVRAPASPAEGVGAARSVFAGLGGAEGLTEEEAGVDLSGYIEFVVLETSFPADAGVFAMPKVGGLPDPFVPCLTR